MADARPIRGSVYKRCACPLADRRACAIDHGSWVFVVDVPTVPGSKRRQVRRSGYPTKAAAHDALESFNMIATATSRPRLRSHEHAAALTLLHADFERLTPPADGPGWVYVAKADGFLKIGYSIRPETRVSELRESGRLIERPAGMDVTRLTMLGAMIGDRTWERDLHHFARNFWVLGEWFTAHPGLENALRALIKVHGIADLRLPEPRSRQLRRPRRTQVSGGTS